MRGSCFFGVFIHPVTVGLQVWQDCGYRRFTVQQAPNAAAVDGPGPAGAAAAAAAAAVPAFMKTLTLT